jgi:hypothetical protein
MKGKKERTKHKGKWCCGKKKKKKVKRGKKAYYKNKSHKGGSGGHLPSPTVYLNRIHEDK